MQGDIRVTVYVGVLFVLQVTLASLNLVFYTRFSKLMDLYALPVTQILYPLAFIALTWPALGVLELVHRLTHVIRSPFPDLSIPRAELYPKFMLIAALDGLSGFLALLPFVYLNSSLLVVLGQVGLPMTLLFSALYLHRRYYLTHYSGAATVVVGVCVAIIPTLDAGIASAHLVLWLCVFLASTVPSAFSKVYQERWLKRYHLHPLYLIACVSLFQLAASVLLLSVLMLPLPAPAPAFSSVEFAAFTRDAYLCFSGTVPAITNATRDLGIETATCHVPWLVFVVYVGINVVYNVVGTTLVKTTSANMSILTDVLRIGVSALLFTWTWLAGPAVAVLGRHTVLSLVVEALGIVTFGARSEIKDVAYEEHGANVAFSPYATISSEEEEGGGIDDDDFFEDDASDNSIAMVSMTSLSSSQ